MLVIIILLLVAIVAIMLFGRAAILAAAVFMLSYLALVVIASVMAITVSELLGSETAAYIAGAVAIILILFALWYDSEEKLQKAIAAEAAASRAFNSKPPTPERKRALKAGYRKSHAETLIDNYLDQVDVAPNDSTDDKPAMPVQKDRLVGRIGRERLKSLHRVSMKDLVSRLTPEGKDVEGSGN